MSVSVSVRVSIQFRYKYIAQQFLRKTCLFRLIGQICIMQTRHGVTGGNEDHLNEIDAPIKTLEINDQEMIWPRSSLGLL